MGDSQQVLKIGNAQGFWGDRPDAPALLVSQAPDLDVLTLDYLAEVSMSILAKQRERQPEAGFPRDFLKVVASLAPAWKSGRKLKLVTNAGGLDPVSCAKAVARTLTEAGISGMKVAAVTGDDVLAQLLASRDGAAFKNWETGRPLDDIRDKLVTANAYTGAAAVAEALARGANIIVTGRVADPSLTVGPCLHHFGWRADDYDRIAGATIAGHLIECGVQSCGGINTDWLALCDGRDIGFPIVEVAADGSCVCTKPPGTGGAVNRMTVTEQLLYEIGDPEHYLSPDAMVSFSGLQLSGDGPDRIRVAGAKGSPPPGTLKVSATYRAGFRAAGTLTIYGREAAAKARRCGQMILDRMAGRGLKPERSLVECLGAGDVVRGVTASDPIEVVLRVAVADPRREVAEYFAEQLMPLVCGGPQGTTGYAEGRPVVREQFGYWPTLIDRHAVPSSVAVFST